MQRLLLGLALLACRASPDPAARAGKSAAPPTAAIAPAARAADRDADGVPDAQDGCPDEPEDLDAFEDGDGCVDRDNDRDSIPDAHELRDGRWTNCDRRLENGVEIDCRNRPEDFDGDADHDGCPDILCIDSCKLFLGTLHVDRQGRPIGDASNVLDEVAAALAAAPSFHAWVEAHLDDRRDARRARELTNQIARDVIEELVGRGVARERLEAIGWADEKPIAHNTTAAGRARNRRVEFKLKTDGCCRPIPHGAAADARGAAHDCK